MRISATTVGTPRGPLMAAIGELIGAIGTESYAATCLGVLDDQFQVDHWALFRYRAESPVRCVASASRIRGDAARENVQRFVQRCHRVDPSLIALREQRSDSACIAEMQVSDIRDRQYRQCFELTRVRERISFFVHGSQGLHQLSIYRGSRCAPLSAAALASFADLANVVIASGTRHERLLAMDALDLESIEEILRNASPGLSQRESEVCARAAAGETIDATAVQLSIQRTSVITYRQRAYQKLGVSRQSELVALVHRLRSFTPLPRPLRRPRRSV